MEVSFAQEHQVKDHVWFKSTIVRWNSTVESRARLENVTVLRDDVTIGDEVYINGRSILPYESIKQNVDGEYCILVPEAGDEDLLTRWWCSAGDCYVNAQILDRLRTDCFQNLPFVSGHLIWRSYVWQKQAML